MRKDVTWYTSVKEMREAIKHTNAAQKQEFVFEEHVDSDEKPKTRKKRTKKEESEGE